MKYVVVFGQEVGYAIGEVESYDSELEALTALDIEINKNNKKWKHFWIQKEILCNYDQK